MNSYSYSPIDLGGAVGGVLVICNDVTVQHLAAEAAKEEHKRLQQLFEQASSFITGLRGPEHRFELINAAYKKLLGNRDLLGRTVREQCRKPKVKAFSSSCAMSTRPASLMSEDAYH